MPPSDKAALVTALTVATYELALAGVSRRHPVATARERFYRLALITLGRDLASRAYPEINQLDRV